MPKNAKCAKKCPTVLKSFKKGQKNTQKKYMKVQKKLRGGGEFQKDPANAKKVPKGQQKKGPSTKSIQRKGKFMDRYIALLGSYNQKGP